MGLKNLVKGRSKTAVIPLTIKDTIKKSFREHNKVLPLDITKDDCIRASGFADMCPRAEVLCSLFNIERENDKDPNLLLTFAHGHGLHFALQNKVLPNLNIFKGQWGCNDCATQYGKPEAGKTLSDCLVFRPEKCSTCGGADFTYKELYFKDENYRVGGHPDGFLELPGRPGLGLFEAKSIGTRAAIDIINGPKIEHIVQMHIYMWLADLSWASILYWDKGRSGHDALTEHIIDRDEGTIDLIKETLLSIWTGIEHKKLPPRICEVQACKKASSCAVSAQCFNNKLLLEKGIKLNEFDV